MNSKNFKAFYRQISIVYFAILMGYVFFMSIIYMITKQRNLPNGSEDLTIFYISLVFGLLLLFFNVKFKNYIKQLALQKTNIREKLSLYFTFFIINISLIEAYGLFNMVWFMSHPNFIFLIIAAYALLLMLLIKPNPDKIIDILQLSKEEQTYIEQPDKQFN